MRKITGYSKAFIEKMIDEGIAPPNRLKHQAILKDRDENGLSVGQICIKHQITKPTYYDIIAKYK